MIDNPVTFTVVLRNRSSVTVTSVELQIENLEEPQLMNQISDNHYELVTSFNESRSYQYSIHVFVDNQLYESSAMRTINVYAKNGGKYLYHFKENFTQNLQKGKYSLSTEDNHFNLDFTLKQAVQMKISRLHAQQLTAQPGMKFLSDGFSIKLNDSSAISDSILQLKYSNMKVLKNRIDPTLLQLSYRNQSDGIWIPQSSVVNTTTQMVSAEVDHFSEWIITAIDPQLRFVNPTTYFETNIGEYLSIPTVIKNFGAAPATNISIRIIATPSVLLNNLSREFLITELLPLDEVKCSWQLYLTEPGEYSVILLTQGDGVDGDLVHIDIVVGNISSNTVETPIFIHFPVIIVMLSLITYVIRKRS